MESITSENVMWRYEPCAGDCRKSIKLYLPVTVSSFTQQDIMKAINETKEDQKIMKPDFDEASYENR